MIAKVPEPAATTEEIYETMHKKTWSRRTAGFLGAATLIGAAGFIGGALASCLPAALNGLGIAGAEGAVLPGIGAVLGNAAIFGAAAGWLGVTIGADVGANAGAATATVEEINRMQVQNGGKPLKLEPQKKPGSLINWKVSLITGALLAVFGAMAAMAPFTAPAVALLGITGGAGSTAAVVAGATITGAFGLLLGMNFPHLSHKLSEGYHKLLKGKLTDKDPAPEPSLSAAVEKPTPTAEYATPERKQDFAATERRATRLAIIEKTEERSEVVASR